MKDSKGNKDSNNGEKKFNDVLRRMLSTPPQPHAPPKEKKPKPSKKKPADEIV